MTETLIRTATDQDREQWLILRKTLFPDCPDYKHKMEMEQILSSEGETFVAERENIGLIGFAEISIRNDHVEGASISPIPYLEGWYVDKRYRATGVGSNLTAAAEEWSRERGFTEIASDSRIDNHTSIAIHKAIGFKEVGRNVQFLKSLVKGGDNTKQITEGEESSPQI